MTYRYCPQCLEKQREIDDLKEEIVRLKAMLRYQERTAKEGLFGSSTSSAKKPAKPNTGAERPKRQGGGKPGHAGHGRPSVSPEDADRTETVEAGEFCPDCGGLLVGNGTCWRTVIDCRPILMETIAYLIRRKVCSKCGHTVWPRPPGVLPKSLYGNQLLSHVALEHYLHGTTLGRLEQQTGAGYSSLVHAMAFLARRLEPAVEKLLDEYRRDPVKHADETGWRTDGQNGYAWLFCTERLSLFRFRKTRSAQVALDVFGKSRLPGTLVVDRYAAYNKLLVAIQYCYAHLLRLVQDLEKNFPGNSEIQAFVAAFAPLLASAMSLRGLPISDRAFYRQAAVLKRKILDVVNQQARHPAIQTVQDVFRQNPGRLYHWARDRTIPADNNLAERDLRPLVIARKVSFGSQSAAGAHTREVLMTILYTLKKRCADPALAFKAALDALAANPALDPYAALFPAQSPKSTRN
jgi:transposase